jgi:cold shock CspA family protein/ribosome-associated translation inhibitor RaiA
MTKPQPVEITFRNIRPSARLEEQIRRRVQKLNHYSADLMSCRVLVELPHRHHRGGNRFHVRIDLKARGKEIVVTRESNLHALTKDLELETVRKSHEVEGVRKDLQVVIRNAFDAARRQLQDYSRRHRGAVKTHEELPHGRVTAWLPAQHFGSIQAADGREIYFHENSVLGQGLKDLRVGAEVVFAEERGRKGPQASTVKLRPSKRNRK